jgi:hemin uptake protein HemP
MTADRNDRPRTNDGRSTHRREPIDEVPSIDSGVLLGADGRVRIRHRGKTYELRETRFGKLILTK